MLHTRCRHRTSIAAHESLLLNASANRRTPEAFPPLKVRVGSSQLAARDNAAQGRDRRRSLGCPQFNRADQSAVNFRMPPAGMNGQFKPCS
jgi:hypothetical protein